jgi:hypothetical protein
MTPHNKQDSFPMETITSKAHTANFSSVRFFKFYNFFIYNFFNNNLVYNFVLIFNIGWYANRLIQHGATILAEAQGIFGQYKSINIAGMRFHFFIIYF